VVRKCRDVEGKASRGRQSSPRLREVEDEKKSDRIQTVASEWKNLKDAIASMNYDGKKGRRGVGW
jgi:peptide subunit release factor 1 (eRF1)